MIDPVQLRRDLSLFSDPATPFTAEEASSSLLVKLVRNEQEREYLCDLDSGNIESRLFSRKYYSLASLLASDEFADLRRFSSTQRRMLSAKNIDNYLEPRGSIVNTREEFELSLETGRQVFMPRPSERLRILLIDGSAGVGKTSFIERMVWERTQDADLPPILHVTSKGRRLSNLSDAIGKTANDADARFRAEQVPVLARLGALQLAIDGFDELVQPDGYQNAWGALRELVRDIRLGGPLILAGRDTFFDQQEILKKFNEFGSTVDISLARLREVDESSAIMWLADRGWTNESLSQIEFREFIKREYPRRPFFLTQIANLRSFNNISADEGSPQQILVSELLSREATLLKQGLPGLSESEIKDGLSQLCEEIAVEMSERESDSTTVSFVEFTSEIVFTDKVLDEYLSAFVRRAGSIALFVVDEEQRGNLAFPHSEILNVFLAKAIARALLLSDIPSTLRSTILGADAIEAFADVYRSSSAREAEQLAVAISSISQQDRYNSRLQSNAAALMLAQLVRNDAQAPISLSDVSINDVRLFGPLMDARLTRCQISNFDLRGTDATKVRFDSTTVSTLLVDETTRFGDTVPEVHVLQLDDAGSVRGLRNPKEITTWINQHSLLAEKPPEWEAHNELPLVKYFDRVCRRFIRQYLIRDNDQDEGSFLLRDPMWALVKSTLGDRLHIFERAAKGTQDLYYQIRDPAKLLNPEQDVDSQRIRSEIVKQALAVN